MPSKSEYVQRSKRKRQEFIRTYKAERGCARCGERHPACLDLHHLDPATKDPRLTKKPDGTRHNKSRWQDLGIAVITAELAKCEVLCANCHRKETAIEWEAQRTESHGRRPLTAVVAQSLFE